MGLKEKFVFFCIFVVDCLPKSRGLVCSFQFSMNSYFLLNALITFKQHLSRLSFSFISEMVRA